MLEAFLGSTGVVALGEIGDKTQLLALMLAARYRRPLPIILGIFAATIFNHTLAAALGAWVRGMLSPDVLRWLLGLSFLAVAAWALVPDTLEEKESDQKSAWGVFALTVATFFMAEIGDKTQVATVMLAARFGDLLPVVCGTTLGMLLADVPVVLLGRALSPKIPLKAVRIAAAGLFALLGILTLLNYTPAFLKS